MCDLLRTIYLIRSTVISSEAPRSISCVRNKHTAARDSIASDKHVVNGQKHNNINSNLLISANQPSCFGFGGQDHTGNGHNY
jgi:hypothetical protein